MNLGDFNDMMRKDRSGFRPSNSKDMGSTDSGPYFEKVRKIPLDKPVSTSVRSEFLHYSLEMLKNPVTFSNSVIKGAEELCL